MLLLVEDTPALMPGSNRLMLHSSRLIDSEYSHMCHDA